MKIILTTASPAGQIGIHRRLEVLFSFFPCGVVSFFSSLLSLLSLFSRCSVGVCVFLSHSNPFPIPSVLQDAETQSSHSVIFWYCKSTRDAHPAVIAAVFMAVPPYFYQLFLARFITVELISKLQCGEEDIRLPST